MLRQICFSKRSELPHMDIQRLAYFFTLHLYLLIWVALYYVNTLEITEELAGHVINVIDFH